ncbi:hypothetical protein AB8965_20185, partial [Yersinia enterocolitica]
GKTLLHGDVLMWLMKTLLTSGCTNQRGAGQWSYQIEPALRKIESPLAGRLRDRFIDGAIFLNYVKKSLNEKLGEGQRPRLSNNL